jgi:hypothetical protein
MNLPIMCASQLLEHFHVLHLACVVTLGCYGFTMTTLRHKSRVVQMNKVTYDLVDLLTVTSSVPTGV